MSKSIKVSPNYGVNPTIPICFFCGKEKNEIVLLGELPNDKEAPRDCVLDYQPCDSCEEKWSEGIPIIEVTDTPNSEGQPPIDSHNQYPTGSWLVADKAGFTDDCPFKEGQPILLATEPYRDFVNKDEGGEENA